MSNQSALRPYGAAARPALRRLRAEAARRSAHLNEAARN